MDVLKEGCVWPTVTFRAYCLELCWQEYSDSLLRETMKGIRLTVTRLEYSILIFMYILYNLTMLN